MGDTHRFLEEGGARWWSGWDALARALTRSAPISGDLALVGIATLCFAVLTVALSGLTGAPMVAPTERLSPAAGIHYSVPLAIGLAGYAVARLASLLIRRRIDIRPGGFAVDACYVVLFVVVLYLHFHIKMWMPIINPALFDQAYLAIDDRLRFLVDFAGAFRAWVVELLPAADVLYQAGFFGMFVLAFWSHTAGERRWHRHNMTAILLLEMIGPLTYLVAPAVGPFVYEPSPNPSIAGAQSAMYEAFVHVQSHGAAWLAAWGGEHFTAPPAAMPSLHVGAAWVITYYALKARLVVAPLFVVVFAWIVIEAVALRWHYLADLPAGLALAAFVIALTNRICHVQVSTAS